MIFLVGSRYGTSWISSNTSEYVDRLQKTTQIPWYYENYVYRNYEDNQMVPCDVNLLPLPRNQLIDSDRALYRLHLRSVKAWQKHGNFYWNCDMKLADDYEKTWRSIIQLSKPSLVLQGKSLI